MQRTVSKQWLTGIALLASSLVGPLAGAAQAQSASAGATAEVVPPATLYKDTDLDFGMIATAGAGGSLTLNATSGAVTTTGDLAPVASHPASRALFIANAPVGAVMVYSGDSTVTLTRNGGTETMTALLSYGTDSSLVTATVLGLPIGVKAMQPEQHFLVGGTLLVGAGQAQGLYEGQFTLSITFL
ncbi:MAG: DUF4402 domain-containing protein [Sphingomonadales bacterium]|nr:DUF4402 domain-containing protein [Sphingomonadales bacterium]